MKKLLLGLTAALMGQIAVAQTSLSEAVDFTVTFTDGTTFNLFDKLAEGKYVVVDWLFTTCGPCQANQGYYTEAYQNFGCNEGDVFFLSIETTVGDAETIAYEETYGGENAPPMASGTDGGGIDAENPYNIAAYPTFILIAPDGEIVEQDMWPLNGTADTFTDYLTPYGIGLMVCATDVEENGVELNANVYPNPAQDAINVELSGFTGEVTIEVYNVLGEQIYNGVTSEIQQRLDVSQWAEGNYVMQLTSGAESTQKKLVVMR